MSTTAWTSSTAPRNRRTSNASSLLNRQRGVAARFAGERSENEEPGGAAVATTTPASQIPSLTMISDVETPEASPHENHGDVVVTDGELVPIDEQVGNDGSDEDTSDEQLLDSSQRNPTVTDLEDERESARRRSCLCFVVAAFILFRLWLEALQRGDLGLLTLCLVVTSLTGRWMRHNREREEDLDRRIANSLSNLEPGGAHLAESDLRMLSFQAQLVLAIMESQHQMMQGGIGSNDTQQEAAEGVSESVRSEWDHFPFKEVDGLEKGGNSGLSKNNISGHESITKGTKDAFEEAPHCAICLGEYEEDEALIRLPCSHVYHEDCITSWTTNHTRCPLCNSNLASDHEEDDSIGDTMADVSMAMV